MANTFHVYPAAGAWAVKRDGEPGEIFDTRQEAFEIAVRNGKKAKSAQVVVHGKDGRILERRTFGLPKIEGSPKKGQLAPKSIAMAVAKVVFDRILADPLPPRAHASPK